MVFDTSGEGYFKAYKFCLPDVRPSGNGYIAGWGVTQPPAPDDVDPNPAQNPQPDILRVAIVTVEADQTGCVQRITQSMRSKPETASFQFPSTSFCAGKVNSILIGVKILACDKLQEFREKKIQSKIQSKDKRKIETIF